MARNEEARNRNERENMIHFCGAEWLSIEISSAEDDHTHGKVADREELTLNKSYLPSHSQSASSSFLFSSHQTTLPPIPETKIACSGPFAPSNTLVFDTLLPAP